MEGRIPMRPHALVHRITLYLAACLCYTYI